MATIRRRQRIDGSTYWQVRYRVDGQETSTSLDDPNDAEEFRRLVEAVGGARARQVHGIDRPIRGGPTVTKWLEHHIEHLSGVERRTPEDYRSYLRNHIAPTLGHIPLTSLTRDDVARWVEKMRDDGASGKSVANRHGFLSSALNAAVEAGHIAANPAVGVRLPRTERDEMRFLSRDEFAALLAEVTEPWRPMVRFLVASGARLSEVTALRPYDVNRTEHTVRISRAWKRGGGGYHLGAPKTKRSVRTIDVPASVLDDLDYSGEWLFTNPGRGRRAAGGPVRAPNFRANVWWPAVERAQLAPPRPRIHDLRHTCASWMITAGVPLPVIQRHLGHESIKTTIDLYGHLDRSSAQAAADAIGRLLGPTA
ncbi:tyrosine-type recombinase/integrase [Mycobacterium branderi]|uniref:Site-specific integrase n=1 Tax=Mycobacterium branderi TaxID=43348 RepID=A0A7I7VZB1_9MYCO|nr:site-specific integrase [Mycobacterium branderi]MCV7232806.1 site-specific integrase [Mycobacterium branderi]ORA41709.1 site-specific integrase [Mycobacterium branderi]BBZ09835.1 site-specific integrase [Mycobacterium branderi]